MTPLHSAIKLRAIAAPDESGHPNAAAIFRPSSSKNPLKRVNYIVVSEKKAVCRRKPGNYGRMGGYSFTLLTDI